MNMVPSELKETEKKGRHLWPWLLSLFVILSSLILLIIFYSDVSKFFQEKVDIHSFNFLLLGYVGLCLLFAGYIVLHEISLRKLRRNLIKEKNNLSLTLGKRYQELKALFEVSTLVNSEVEPSKILHLISKQAMNCLDADSSSLMVLDQKAKKLRCMAAYGYKNEHLQDAEVEVGKGVCGWVFERNQPLLLDPDNFCQYEFLNLVEKEDTIFSALCVPLKVKGKTKGVLNVNSFRADKKFAQEDLKLLAIFAESASVSIEKAELYQEYEKQAKDLKKTLTELICTQNQLIDSQKMRALGDLARGMAHDFNNVLAIAAGRAELSLNQTQDEKIRKSLTQILQAVSEGQKTVRRLQEFYRTRSESGWVEIDLNNLIQEVVEVTRHKWQDEAQARGIKIEVETRLGEAKPVSGNLSEVLEAFTNLMLNAMEAMPQGGKIILTAKTEGDSVIVSVEDTGIGMNQEVKARIFDPFFTTKTTRNAGLGLSLVYGVISRHKGEIEVESKEGFGTTFRIKLPTSKEPKKEMLKETKQALSLDPANVLVIDDNKEVRDIIAEILTAKKHNVTQAEDGVKALKLFDEKNRFDLVFVNLSLPELSGWEVIQRVKEKEPEIKVALLTGWGAQIDFQEAKEKGADFLLGSNLP